MVLAQLAHPTDPKLVHIEWDEGSCERSGSEIHFSCEGSWAQCRLAAEPLRFTTHRDALKAFAESGELRSVMPTSLAGNGDLGSSEDDVHAQYTWLYCERPSGKHRKPMMTLEEFEAKERRCGVRALRLTHIDSGFVRPKAGWVSM